MQNFGTDLPESGASTIDVEVIGVEQPDPNVEYPEVLPILPVRDTVLYPHAVMPLNIGRDSSIEVIRSLGENKFLGVVTQRDPSVDQPTPKQLYEVGTLAIIHKVVRMPNDTLLIFTEGLRRIRLTEFVTSEPYYSARYEQLEEVEPEPDKELEALRRSAVSSFNGIVELSPSVSDEVQTMVKNIDQPGRLADFMAATLPGLVSSQRQDILETLDVRARLQQLVVDMAKEREVLDLRQKIQSEVQGQLSQSQREFYLREQMKAIQKELGDVDENAEVDELRTKIEESKMPEEALKEAQRELKRLQRMSPAAADYTVTRTYLDWMVALPWQKSTGKKVNVVRAKKILDEDHFDLEKVKERILDYLAVLQLKPSLKGPILCFVGPPGVGKTSLAKSIARALGRKFGRMSLGGMHDEAEIRGHRRTYIGALPGQIIQSIRRAGANDPVFILDEIDKLGRDFRGDPASALLEVLDPEQNNSFRDHYLDVPFDLSKVLFITTANILDTIPGPLRDRMEVLHLQGYTEGEKIQIARNYLIERQIKENGITGADLVISDAALSFVIRRYTREAGVRNLEREIGSICRKRARQIAEGRSVATKKAAAKKKSRSRALKVTPEVVEKFLGPPKLRDGIEIADRTKIPGVAVGLAWTPFGGDVLILEASKMPGSGKALTLTGHLGKVMQESMQTALSWVRAHSKEVAVDSKIFKTLDIHVHVPAGAIPKDGPSAGVTVVTALVSLLTGRRVRPNLAMTGEVTLSGLVLPVGGIKEKVLAARRVGVTELILPKQNEVDVGEDLKDEQLEGIRIRYAENVSQVIGWALVKRRPVRKTARKKVVRRSPHSSPRGE
jgi:ATP-dependent Lon protease